MNLQTDQMGDPLTTHPIQIGRAISGTPYLNWRFRCIDTLGCQFVNGSISTQTRTQSQGPKPLLPVTRCMLHSLDAVLIGCYTRWKLYWGMLHLVDAALGGCCTLWMLDSVDAVLGGCCTRWILHLVLTPKCGVGRSRAMFNLCNLRW